MKKALLMSILSIFSVLTAFAEVKLPGTFIPHQCGEDQTAALNVRPYTVDQICMGSIAGSSRKAISLEYHTRTRNFKTVLIVVKTTPVNAGINPKYSRSNLTLTDKSALISRASVTYDRSTKKSYISGKTHYGIEFNSEALHTVYVTE